MATTSTVFGYPIPEGEDPNNVPGDVADLVAELDKSFAGARLTQAQIDALPAAYKAIGVHVYNLTAGRLERWTGSAWVSDLATKSYVDALGTWQSYTPTLTAETTNPTGWTGTGFYTQIGKLVHVKGIVSAGVGANAGSGVYRIALPVSADTTITNAPCAGSVWIDQSSNGTFNSYAVAYTNSATWFCMKYAAGSIQYVSHSIPSQWTAGDYIQFAFSYQAA